MKKNILWILAALVMVFISCRPATQSSTKSKNAVASAGAEGKGQAYVPAVKGEQANALQVAQSMDDFSTLVTAIRAAGVENAVVNAGPLTIFAPLNSAFDKLPKGTVETLLKPENKGKLAFILTNHVAPSNYPIRQLQKEASKGRKLYMASGKYLDVKTNGQDIMVDGVKILKSVKVSNGWIHVIDQLLVPSE